MSVIVKVPERGHAVRCHRRIVLIYVHPWLPHTDHHSAGVSGSSDDGYCDDEQSQQETHVLAPLFDRRRIGVANAMKIRGALAEPMCWPSQKYGFGEQHGA
jgi:hypothetical protein